MGGRRASWNQAMDSCTKKRRSPDKTNWAPHKTNWARVNAAFDKVSSACHAVSEASWAKMPCKIEEAMREREPLLASLPSGMLIGGYPATLSTPLCPTCGMDMRYPAVSGGVG